MPLFEKIETIAKRIYRADEVLADQRIRDQLRHWEEAGYGNLPVCWLRPSTVSPTRTFARRACPVGGPPVRRRRLHRRDLWRDYDHAGPAAHTGCREHYDE